jgi:hypothetical protein
MNLRCPTALVRNWSSLFLNSILEICDCRFPIETRLLPSSLAASHRGFAFCLADPIGSAADFEQI